MRTFQRAQRTASRQKRPDLHQQCKAPIMRLPTHGQRLD
jgi:hypothetical protein